MVFLHFDRTLFDLTHPFQNGQQQALSSNVFVLRAVFMWRGLPLQSEDIFNPPGFDACWFNFNNARRSPLLATPLHKTDVGGVNQALIALVVGNIARQNEQRTRLPPKPGARDIYRAASACDQHDLVAGMAVEGNAFRTGEAPDKMNDRQDGGKAGIHWFCAVYFRG